MGILDKVVKIEKRIEKLASRKDAAVAPIEIRRAILDDIEAQVHPAGRGRRVFPYDEIAVEVLAGRVARKGQARTHGDTARMPGRAELEAVLDPDAGLTDAIRERLEEAGCERVGPLQVSVTVVAKRRQDWQAGALFRVTYQRTGATPARSAASAVGRGSTRPASVAAEPEMTAGTAEVEQTGTVRAHLSVVEGEATRKGYTLTGERTNIGRLAEVTDKHRRVVRRNQVIFLDVDTEANQTVSRAQAHIRFAPPDEYRLYDDHSSYGTRIAREGRMIEIPSGSPRGVKLQPGDEIYFGRARVVFQIR